MKTYKITFTPVEPYFFGNERTFRFPGKKIEGQFDTPYFIRSEKLPSQTTLFGAVRYLMLKNRFSVFTRYPDGYEKIIGSKSFVISDDNSDFGVIKNISSLFMVKDGEDGVYVRTPLDHMQGKDTYSPLARERYSANKEYAPDYDPKSEAPDGFMSLDNKQIVSDCDIFKTSVRTGIDTVKKDKAFFKKEYVMLEPGWSFGIYLSVSDDAEGPDDGVVHLGQNKSAFIVKVTEEENCIPNVSDVEKMPESGCIYCIGDSLVPNDIYSSCSMAITAVRDYRAFETVYKDGCPTFKKHDVLYKLIRSGSVFCYCNPEQRNGIIEALKNKHCNIIGMNSFMCFASNDQQNKL